MSSFTSFIPKDAFWSGAAVAAWVFFEEPFTDVLPLEAALEDFGLETIARFFDFG
jgi:hypothetical protein